MNSGEGLGKIFVYGTLRRGQRYRYLIERFIVKERPATIRAAMYHYAPCGEPTGEYPYIAPGHGFVHGEVLVLRDYRKAIELLDKLEECPELYIRKDAEAEYPGGGKERVEAYFIRPGRERPGRKIESGDWIHERRSLDRT